MVLLLPDRVEVPVDGLGPLLGLAHLDRDVGVAGARLILGLETLGTNNYKHNIRGSNIHKGEGST